MAKTPVKMMEVFFNLASKDTTKRTKAETDFEMLLKTGSLSDTMIDLAEDLVSDDRLVRKDAALALGQIAAKGVDVIIAIDSLLDGLYSEDAEFSANASFALAMAAKNQELRKIIFDEVGICLYHTDANVKLACLNVVYHLLAVDKAIVVDEFLPEVRKLSGDSNEQVRKLALSILSEISK